MIPTLLVYAVLVSALVALGAMAAEEVCRAAGRPVRLIWLGALLSAVVLVGLAPLRTAQSDRELSAAAAALSGLGDKGATDGAAGGAGEGEGVAGAAGLARLARAPSVALIGLRRVVEWPLRVSFTRASSRPTGAAADGAWGGGLMAAGPGSVPGILWLAWLAGSAGLILLGAATLLRSGASRRRWPLRAIAGTEVRVSPASGPAVLGVLRPEIVVPEWLLARSPEEQRVVILHEREHVRARDPLTLTAGWLAVALVPWNPVSWWMVHRLRLSVELDCDARVLRRGVPPRTYGSVLIDMAGRGSGLPLPLGVPALAGTRSTLERRLLAMSTGMTRFAPLRAVAFGALGAIALLAACEARIPTSAEIDAMDVATAELHAQEYRILDAGAEEVVYFVDGAEVSADEARAFPADRIARLEVIRARDDAPARVRFMTGDSVPPLDAHTMSVRGSGTDGEPGRRGRVALRAHEPGQDGHEVIVGREGDELSVTPLTNFQGLLVIDGVLARPADFRALLPERIESIEVIKGAAATRLYDSPRARDGVILVTTRP